MRPRLFNDGRRKNNGAKGVGTLALWPSRTTQWQEAPQRVTGGEIVLRASAFSGKQQRKCYVGRLGRRIRD